MTFKSRAHFAVSALLAAVAVLALPAVAQRPDRDLNRLRERAQPPHMEHREHGEHRRPVGGDWESLGVIDQAPIIERKSISIGREQGRYGRIGLQVTEGTIELIELQVRYGNGTSETFPANETIGQEARTRTFDLTGHGRFLEEVTVVYRPVREARIEIFADPLRESRPGPRWQQLGCQRVGLFEREDIIQVGGLEGRYSQLKLTADGGNVRLDRLRIVYGNGSVDDVSVRAVLPNGTETRALNLPGLRRRIERIQLFYLPSFSPDAGRATVCAFGS